jgi:hypothetical protein
MKRKAEALHGYSEIADVMIDPFFKVLIIMYPIILHTLRIFFALKIKTNRY